MANKSRKKQLGEETWTYENRCTLHLLFMLWTPWPDDKESLLRIFHRMYPGFERCRYTVGHLRDQWQPRKAKGRNHGDWKRIDKRGGGDVEEYSQAELDHFANLRNIIVRWAIQLRVTLHIKPPPDDWTEGQRRQQNLLRGGVLTRGPTEALTPEDHGQRLPAMTQYLTNITYEGMPGMPVYGISLPNTIGVNGVQDPHDVASDADDFESGEDQDFSYDTRADEQQRAPSALRTPKASRKRAPPETNSSAEKPHGKRSVRRSTRHRNEDTLRGENEAVASQGLDDDAEPGAQPDLQALAEQEVDLREENHLQLEMLHRNDVQIRAGAVEMTDSSFRSSKFIDHGTAVFKYGGCVYRLRLDNRRNSDIIPPNTSIMVPVMLCNTAICSHCSDSVPLETHLSLALRVVENLDEEHRLPLVHSTDIEIDHEQLRFRARPRVARGYQSGLPPPGNVEEVVFNMNWGRGEEEMVMRTRICIKDSCSECKDEDDV